MKSYLLRVYQYIFFLSSLTILSGCLFGGGKKKADDLILPEPAKSFALKVEGNELYTLLGKKLKSDTMLNAIKQLGKYRFSTSMDEYYPYPGTAEYLTYEFKGITFEVIGSGMDITRNELQKTFEEYSNSFWLETITIETENFKKSLPYGLKANNKPSEVEKILGKHDDFFMDHSTMSYFEYEYPNKGINVRFVTHFSDTIISQITLLDSIAEMKRYPTKFGVQDSTKQN